MTTPFLPDVFKTTADDRMIRPTTRNIDEVMARSQKEVRGRDGDVKRNEGLHRPC